jgi:hypothetical protein
MGHFGKILLSPPQSFSFSIFDWDCEGGDNEHENEDEGEAPLRKKIGGENNLLLFQQTTELNVVRSTSWRFSSPAKQPF